MVARTDLFEDRKKTMELNWDEMTVRKPGRHDRVHLMNLSGKARITRGGQVCNAVKHEPLPPLLPQVVHRASQ